MKTITTLEEALVEIKDLNEWINALQARLTVNCVYCGYNYGPSVCPQCNGSGVAEYRGDHTTDKLCSKCFGSGAGAPVAMAEVLKHHIEKCPKHPMSGLRTALVDIRDLARNAMVNHKINRETVLEEISFRVRKALREEE
jgi:hypothetical protein